MTTTTPRTTSAEGPPPATSPGTTERKVAANGIALVAAAYLGVAVFAGATLPWRGTADAFDHLDYVYQLLHGHLPAPFGHEWVPVDRPGPSPDSRQWVAQHPPLFYLLVAPLAAPFLDADWRLAVASIRAANILVGLGGVVVLGWLGWMIGGRWRVRLAIALPGAGAGTFAYVRYSAEVYNDTLLTTLSLLALALMSRMILRGLSVRPLLLLAVVCVLGLGTKATFVLTLGVVAVGLVTAALLNTRGHRGRALLAGAGAAVTVGVPPVLAWGWFYARNASLSGSWYQTTPDDVQVLDRPHRSTWEVLTDPEFYLLVPTELVGQATPAYAGFAAWSSGIVFAVAAALTLAVVVRSARAQAVLRPATVLVVGLLLGHLGGSYLLQLSHASGYGAYNWRYFLPATAGVALILGLGAASLGRLSALFLPALVIALGVLNAGSYVDYGVNGAELPVDPRRLLPAAQALAVENDLPALLPVMCLAVALGAALVLGVLIARHPDHFRGLPRARGGEPRAVGQGMRSDVVAPPGGSR